MAVSSIIGVSLPIGNVLLSDLVLIMADNPDPSLLSGGTIDRVIGLQVKSQATLGAVGLTTWGIRQEGTTDLNFFAGIPARTATSHVVVRENGTNLLKRIVGASGTFTTVDGKTVTVLDGVITAIV
jgi:hypothetical protein